MNHLKSHNLFYFPDEIYQDTWDTLHFPEPQRPFLSLFCGLKEAPNLHHSLTHTNVFVHFETERMNAWVKVPGALCKLPCVGNPNNLH